MILYLFVYIQFVVKYVFIYTTSSGDIDFHTLFVGVYVVLVFFGVVPYQFNQDRQ